MTTKTYSATLVGLDPIKIEVEVTALAGIPTLVIIGLPNKAIEEARERITACFAVLKIPLKHRRTIVNLAPADVKKTRSSLELAILAALLQLYNVLKLPPRSMLFGELSLAGDIKPITGLLPLVLAAQKMGARHVFIPAANSTQLPTIPNLHIYPLSHIKQLTSYSRNQNWPRFSQPKTNQSIQPLTNPFAQIVGHDSAKRALQIAVAGRHNLLLIGPPGTGKTKLAQTVPHLMPQLTPAQSLEVTSIYSLHHKQSSLVKLPPFRAPHHSLSLTSMLGGGSQLIPGELTLAHHGVLFLDELAEFPRHILESLRQPLEDKQLVISRVHGSTLYPCNFLLLAATNPCPCGFYGSQNRPCSCPPGSLTRYWQKLSGPLWDRFDMQIWLNSISSQDLIKNCNQALQITPRTQVTAAISHQQQRYLHLDQRNGDYHPDKLHQLVSQLDTAARLLVQTAANKFSLSSRAIIKIIAVSRTIADMENSSLITEKYIQEALSYRLNQVLLAPLPKNQLVHSSNQKIHNELF